MYAIYVQVGGIIIGLTSMIYSLYVLYTAEVVRGMGGVRGLERMPFCFYINIRFTSFTATGFCFITDILTIKGVFLSEGLHLLKKKN